MPRKTSLRLKSYAIISDSIGDAIPAGIRKYLKYNDNHELSDGEIEALADKIHEYIMLDLGELIDWDKSA